MLKEKGSLKAGSRELGAWGMGQEAQSSEHRAKTRKL